jgi:hypothetical protein
MSSGAGAMLATAMPSTRCRTSRCRAGSAPSREMPITIRDALPRRWACSLLCGPLAGVHRRSEAARWRPARVRARWRFHAAEYRRSSTRAGRAGRRPRPRRIALPPVGPGEPAGGRRGACSTASSPAAASTRCARAWRAATRFAPTPATPAGAPGQLDIEVNRGDWFIGPADSDAVFTERPSAIWDTLIERFSGDWASLH